MRKIVATSHQSPLMLLFLISTSASQPSLIFAIFCFLSFDGQFSACCVVSDLLNVLYIVVQCSVNDPGWLCQLACLLEIWESDISSILDRHDVKSSWWRQQFVGRLAHYSACLYIRTDQKSTPFGEVQRIRPVCFSYWWINFPSVSHLWIYPKSKFLLLLLILKD